MPGAAVGPPTARVQAAEREAEEVARATTTTSDAAPSTPGQGADLPGRVGRRLGAPSPVPRLRTDPESARAVDRAGAAAVTVDGQIAFGTGQYAPGTPSGDALLAHEMAHVLQGEREPGLRGTPLLQPRQAMPPPPDPPDVVLQRTVDQLDTLALPAFQQALDAVSEAGVRVAGMSVAALCASIDGAYREAVTPVGVPTTPPAAAVPGASGGASAAPATTPPAGPSAPPAAVAVPIAPPAVPPLIGPPAPGPEGARDRAAWQYQRARSLLGERFTTQRFRGTLVLGERAVTASVLGDLAPYAIERADVLAWVVKDTSALIALLRRDTLAETDQWTAIGLLRQHPNPWEFSYALAAVRANDLQPRIERFAAGPLEAYRTLIATITQIQAAGPIAPGEEPGLLELRAAEGTVRLLQPLSGAELTTELYGSAGTWDDLVVAYNRSLRGRDPARWLPVGTVVVVAVDQLTDSYRTVFGYARQMRRTQQERGSEPYLVVRAGEETLAIGNTVTVGVVWPNSLFAAAGLRWWIENDPVAVREHRIPGRVDGPTGAISMVPAENRNTSFEARAAAPGRHTVRCELTEANGRRQVLERSFTVLTLDEKLAAEARRDLPFSARPATMLADLRRERDRLTAGSTQRRQIDTRIAEIERTLGEADAEQRRYRGHQAHLSGVRAVYVSAEGLPMTVPLNIFVDSDPGYFDALDYVLKLWDFTLQGSIRSYTARGERPQEALVNLLRTFADDAPYPTGSIRFEITPSTMGYSGIHRETVIARTDGGTQLAGALRALSMVAMGVGVVAAVALQAEIALPAFAVAGVLAGAGGAFSLYDRLEHGDFAWDLQTGLDLLDIAGAVLTFGVASGGTAAVRGVGRMTFGARAQLAVGTVQVGVMAGIHVAQIEGAIRSGDRDRVAQALLAALRDGALILVVHRAASRLGSARGVPREEPPVTRTPPEVTPPAPATPTTRTATGTVPPGEGAPPAPPARPGTPEHQRQVHDQWVENLRQTGLAERPATPRTAEPLRPGDDIPTIQEAHRVYEDLLARNPTREVGIYRNSATGAYAVRVGTEMSVSGPLRGRWESVLHYHPNQANVLTHRMPAPADVQGAAIEALRSGRPVTEFVDVQLPTGGRSRCAYRATPSGEVTIEYVRPDGTRVSRSFASLGDYQRAYGSRTTYLDPNSPEYRWVVEDLHDFYRSAAFGGEGPRSGGTAGGQRTARGTTRQAGERSATEVEAAARAESMAWWQSPGVTTETRFARHEQTFDSVASTLRNTIEALRASGRGRLLPHLDEAVLREPVDLFVRRDPVLGPRWRQMERDARSNPGLRREMTKFLEGRLESGGSREVGSRRPDLIEFFLERGDVVVTDVVYSIDGNYLRVHAFKTDFYRAVVTRMIGGRGGPRVSGLDLNLRPIRPESIVTP